MSYHTKGEEIYWHFGQSTRAYPRDKTLAQVLSRATGYPLCEAKGSAGGYKDWCISALKIPAFTVETGAEHWQHPLGEDALETMKQDNAFAFLTLAEAVCRENARP